MNRRNFIKNSSAASIAITALAACNAPVDANKKPEARSNSSTSTSDFKLNEVTIDELQQRMQSGEYSSRSITEMYLKRIDDIDKKDSAINAVIELNPDALSIADERDRERKAGKVR